MQMPGAMHLMNPFLPFPSPAMTGHPAAGCVPPAHPHFYCLHAPELHMIALITSTMPLIP